MHAASSSHPIQLVVFDLGRVLIRVCDGWEDACERAGVVIDPDRIDSEAFVTLTDLAHRHEMGQLGLRDFAEKTAKIIGVAPEEVCLISHAYLFHAFAGTAELLDELRGRKVPTACLSNTNENHWRIMHDPNEPAHMPLDRLDYRFASHLLGTRKPDPAIYERVEHAVELAGRAILFFDDVAENVEAARQRGWNVYHVPARSDNPIPLIRAELARFGLIG